LFFAFFPEVLKHLILPSIFKISKREELLNLVKLLDECNYCPTLLGINSNVEKSVYKIYFEFTDYSNNIANLFYDLRNKFQSIVKYINIDIALLNEVIIYYHSIGYYCIGIAIDIADNDIVKLYFCSNLY
jgi:hypothetical protein